MAHPAPTLKESVRTGLPNVGNVPWGTHLCHFYRSVEDLRDPLVDFIRTGIENGEQCLWVTSPPLRAKDARAALAHVIPRLSDLEQNGQVTILDFEDWYTAGGQMDGEAVVRHWIDNEQQALSRGYAGLRLTGNTSWLEPGAWEDFAAYEASVHEVFHGRRVLALCSYALHRCGADDVLDVLRNHEFALVRQHGSWSLVRSATELLAAVNASGPPPNADHRARFFHEGSYPADALAEFLQQVPASSAVVLAPEAHLELIRTALRRRGADPAGMHMYDADRLMRDSATATIDLHGTIRGLVEAATSGGCKAHVYGELVDVLSGRDDKAGAVSLEEYWNELLQNYDFTLWCGYDLEHFGPDEAEYCTKVCACHNHVELDVPTEEEHVFAQALMEELAQRRSYERERTRLLWAERQISQRLASLQRITSFLSEAVTQDDIADVVHGELGSVVGAERALMLVFDADANLRVPKHAGDASQAVARAADAISSGVACWVEQVPVAQDCALQSSESAQSCAVLPLKLHGRMLGAVSMEFSTKQHFDSSQRALIEDVCSQVSLALERSRLYEEAERQRTLAENAGRAKDQFIAMLGHELRNPLAALQTAAELLAVSGNSSEMLARTQSIVARQTSHMAKLIDDLLDVSRIVWGRSSCTPLRWISPP